ncbi:MAG TPA: DUF362 domain-containing protein [Gemmataceae bacterium]|nr:DUF362 domain-containing protein [Gemmataceae bacterium]
MNQGMSRREFLWGSAVVGASALGLGGPGLLAAPPKSPSSPVSIAGCKAYDFKDVLGQLRTMMDHLGGLRKLVAGKTVCVKVNLTGNPRQKALDLPASRTYHTHPHVVLAVATLLEQAGARRLRVVETTYQKGPLEGLLKDAGWDLSALAALSAKVEYEDTRNKGQGKRYHEVKVPGGGSLYPAYLLNHSYVDCDVYVSLAKLKNHATAGVTLSLKNNFGITPTALYSQHENNEESTSARVEVFHKGTVRPAEGVPQELADTPRKPSQRVPRHTVDAVGIRPIDLAIIDGIETVSGGEGPWLKLARQAPGLLLAGRNAVCTDAVATAVMGYDPTAAAGTGPFPGDNHLALAAALGLGTNKPDEIEVCGLPLKEARHPFRWEPATRND